MTSWIASIPNWHRYLYGVLSALLAIFTAIAADPRILPPPLEDLHLWAPFLVMAIGAVMVQLPRIQLPTGPGAPAILSPPAKDASGTIRGRQPPPAAFVYGDETTPPTTLRDGHALPPRPGDPR